MRSVRARKRGANARAPSSFQWPVRWKKAPPLATSFRRQELPAATASQPSICSPIDRPLSLLLPRFSYLALSPPQGEHRRKGDLHVVELLSEEMAVKINASSRQRPIDFTGDVVKLSWDDILPRSGDTLADLVARREKVAGVICASHSLAVALGVLDSGHDAPSAEEVAEPNFNEVERRVQAYFEEKGQLPKMNFDKDRLAKSTQPGGKNVKERRRLALARLYGKNAEEVTLGNVYYVESKMSPMLPLITRMDKIICAERRLDTIDSWEQVEYRTVKQVHSKLVAAENSVMAEHKWLVKQSESHRETFNGRLLSARAKDSSKQHPNHLGQ